MRPFLTFLSVFTLLFFSAPALCLTKPPTVSEPSAFLLPEQILWDGTTVATADLLVESLAAQSAQGYHPEALKAAAVAAATALEIRYRETGTADGIQRLRPQEAKKRWGDYWFSVYWPQLQQAVGDTWGQRLTEGGTLYPQCETFPLSWGTTNQGIDCPYDFTANEFEREITVSIEEFASVFPQYKKQFTVKKAQSGRVETVTSGDTVYTGQETADRFSLPSPAFSVTVEQTNVVFLCFGQGDGNGMSLYGANELAKRGASYDEILSVFFPRATLTGADQEANRSLGSR